MAGLNFALIVEVTVALAMAIAVVVVARFGRRYELSRDRGFRLTFIGFALLLIGSLVDISDHFPVLDRFVFLGRTPGQYIAEKLIGHLGGFCLLVIGLWRWLPVLGERRKEEASLRQTTLDLERRLRDGSSELERNRRQSEKQIAKHEQAERLTREILEAFMSGSSLALIAVGRTGAVDQASGSAMGALLQGRIVGARHFLEIFPAKRRELDRVLAGEEIVAEHQAGKQTFQLRGRPRLDPHDKVIGGVFVAHEITELKSFEAELQVAKDRAEAASSTKSQFLANMSHELRTPLNSIIGFARLLEKNRDRNLSERDLQFLNRIGDNGRHLLELINQILDLSKVEAGHVALELTRVDLIRLLTKIAEEIRSQVREGLRLEVILPERCLPIETDAERLRQIVNNLLGNALKFTEKGQVTLRLVTDAANRAQRIDVADTGIGIPADRFSAIFEAFQQVEGGTARRFDGSGLGLAIARSLANRLGFELQLLRSQEGEGSTCSVLLGQAVNREPPSREVDLSGATSSLIAGWRILVIDDDDDTGLLVGKILEDLACIPILVRSGEEGLSLAARERPNVILLDLMMPEPDGWEVLRRLRADPGLAQVPVIVISAVADRIDARQRADGSVIAFLAKGERLDRELRKTLIALRLQEFESDLPG